MNHTFFREHSCAGYFGKTDVMAKFTPSLSGVKGRALFTVIHHTAGATIRNGET
jgi:iron complex outermembrane receptor protein